MALAILKRLRYPGLLPVVVLVIGLFVVLDFMSDAVQNSEGLSRSFVPLLLLVLLGLLALTALVVVNVVKLIRRYRQQTTGSRLTGRILVRFAWISLLPVGIVYYYSLGFLLQGIDSWFDVEIDRAMKDAIALNQASLNLNQRVLLRYSEQLLEDIEDDSLATSAPSLEAFRSRAGALEATILDAQGQLQGYASEDPTQLVPDPSAPGPPEREILQRVLAGTNYVGLEPRADDELVVRVLVMIPISTPPRALQVIFPTSQHLSGLSRDLENAYNRYTELAYLRKSLKLSFSVTLSLVLVFSLMAALIAAFHTAQRLVAPVADIAHGTRAVAAGDYEQQLPVPSHKDELAFLVASFNAMTHRIAQARDTAARSRQAVEAQRAYLETVLGRLSSGVVTIAPNQYLHTTNPAARHILGLLPNEAQRWNLGGLARRHPRVSPWVKTVQAHLDGPEDWRAEITLLTDEGRQILLCRGGPLMRPGNEGRGHVVVFDDITTLMMAQRDAAWGEVARRLAHEIKNPLTPIRLSAERLRHKLLPKLQDRDASIVDQATATIVAQVEAMKSMVDDFSNYARPPKMETEPLCLDDLVSQIIDLYRSAGSDSDLTLTLAAPDVRIMGDPLRLRQVIHNLVKNAQEAMVDHAEPRILVATAQVEHAGQPCVELRIQDRGGGIDEALLATLFDPYVTSKAKGTGLGLAIVKKIIEEHGGIIRAENVDGGALLTARFPVEGVAEGGTRRGPGRDRHVRPR
ncbi:MAG: HAMP domain-containing protein [Candidatus Thiosymbion ectosymbiont of Robbea hypermnestra]|nr:HAMP domain-containing protein [Candidatus Thiosymbion ectosymbiont of Robbea hypermnestra]